MKNRNNTGTKDSVELFKPNKDYTAFVSQKDFLNDQNSLQNKIEQGLMPFFDC
jgi:hypothetical protein